MNHNFNTVIVLSKSLMILWCFYLDDIRDNLKNLWIFSDIDHLMKLSSNIFQLAFSFLLCDNQQMILPNFCATNHLTVAQFQMRAYHF